jgi:uncharacterized protein YbjT (DUF2867 family)
MILVTGASGNVGRALLPELSAAGLPARAAFHSAEKAASARSAGQDALVIDLAKPDTLRPALQGVDAVFLLGSGGLGQTQGEINVVDAAKAAGVKRIVKLSVIGAAEEEFEFARIHRPVERAIEASGLAWTFLRPTSYMQNFSNFMGATIKSQHAMYTTIPDARFSHVDTRDVARVAAAVFSSAGHDGKAYTLTGPSAFSYRDAAATIGAVTGTPVNVVPISDVDARAGMKAAGIPDFYAEYLIDLDHYYRDGEADVVTSDVRAITGREPTSFEQFVRDHIGAFAG